MNSTCRSRCTRRSDCFARVCDGFTSDRFVLATASGSWKSSTVDAVTAAFTGSRCRVQLLVDVDRTDPRRAIHAPYQSTGASMTGPHLSNDYDDGRFRKECRNGGGAAGVVDLAGCEAAKRW